MHGGCDDLPANLAEKGERGRARRWRKFTRRARERENDGRARARKRAQFRRLSVYEVPSAVSFVGIHAGADTESELVGERHNAALSANGPVPRRGDATATARNDVLPCAW